jgi:mannosyltransferase
LGKLKKFAPVAFVTGVAAFLRFYRLGWQSFWVDEVLSSSAVTRLVRYLVKGWDANPPLFFILEKIFLSVGFSTSSDSWLRFPPALFGTMTVLASYLIVRQLVDQRAAFWTSLLWALMPYHVYYSQEFRMYSLACLAAMGTLYFWNRAMESNGSRAWKLFAGFAVAGLYTHHWSLFLVGSLIAWGFFEQMVRRESLRLAVSSYLFIALCYLPMAFLLRYQLRTVIFLPTHRSWAFTFEIFSGLKFGDLYVVSISVWKNWLAVGLCLSLLVGGYFSEPSPWRRRRIFWAGLVVPLSGSIAATEFLVQTYNSRYAIIYLPAFFLTLAPVFRQRKAVFAWSSSVLAGLWLFLMIPVLCTYYTTSVKGFWKQMVADMWRDADHQPFAVVNDMLMPWDRLPMGRYSAGFEVQSGFSDNLIGKIVYWPVESPDPSLAGIPPSDEKMIAIMKKLPTRWAPKWSKDYGGVRLFRLEERP